MGGLLHDAAVEPYRTAVGVRPRARRAIYGTRYLVRCSCGVTVDCRDYISARRWWRSHASESAARKNETTIKDAIYAEYGVTTTKELTKDECSREISRLKLLAEPTTSDDIPF